MALQHRERQRLASPLATISQGYHYVSGLVAVGLLGCTIEARPSLCHCSSWDPEEVRGRLGAAKVLSPKQGNRGLGSCQDIAQSSLAGAARFGLGLLAE